MIMVDTSVWVEYFNGRRNTHTDLLDTLLYNDEVVLGDLILMEILQGFRNDRDYALAKSRLAKLTIFELLGVDAAQQCAENYRQLRKLGSTVRKSVDVIIASSNTGRAGDGKVWTMDVFEAVRVRTGERGAAAI